MDDITDADCEQAKRVERLLNKNLGEYHDFYVQSITYYIPYYLQMYLNVFAISVLKYLSLIQLTFFQQQD